VRKIALQNIRNFGCRGTNLIVHAGEMLVLLGPNGAGKTTLLNVIAGLVAYEGRVLFDDESVDSLPPRRRKVGYVFQDLALFPHLDVCSNIGYGLRAANGSKEAFDRRIKELMDFFRIGHLRSRYPSTLSGGERQRVALARALAPRPKILLLDEPFNNLDPQTSVVLRNELKRLQGELETTTVFVTHDLAEAETLADRVAVMRDGLIHLVGSFSDIVFSTRDQRNADSIETANVLECQTVREIAHGLSEVRCNGLKIIVPHNGKTLNRIAILPGDVSLFLESPTDGINVFNGTIREIITQPGSIRAVVDTGGCQLLAEMPKLLWESGYMRCDSDVYVELTLTKIRAG